MSKRLETPAEAAASYRGWAFVLLLGSLFTMACEAKFGGRGWYVLAILLDLIALGYAFEAHRIHRAIVATANKRGAA